LSSRKLDGLVWHSRLSGFPVLEASCPIAGRRLCSDRLLYSSPCSQNLQPVLGIPGESASASEPMVHTTLPKVDNVDASLAEAPMARALVARLGSKAPDDNPADDDPDLLNFTMVEFWIFWRMSSLPQNY
jgi:hypothetical protein